MKYRIAVPILACSILMFAMVVKDQRAEETDYSTNAWLSTNASWTTTNYISLAATTFNPSNIYFDAKICDGMRLFVTSKTETNVYVILDGRIWTDYKYAEKK